MDTLIISEKPSVAARIAAALGRGNERRSVSREKVSYYEFEGKSGKVYVVAAVGHLFTITQANKERGYPVLDVRWAPSYEASPASAFTKKYLDVIREVASHCETLINACDFDIEGTVIGTNIIRFAGSSDPVRALASARRMKFSTTTDHDLQEAYAKLMPLDTGNFDAGEARHMLDWLWGINLSRALTRAVYGWNVTKSNVLSIGRVQGPTLSILATREREISAFVPRPFWRVASFVHGVELLNVRGDMFEEAQAKSAYDKTASNSDGLVESSDAQEKPLYPYPPFDLTSLQLEASRILRLDPTRTLALAQSLYERSYISYPRTSSQKLPQSLGLKEIIKELAKNADYAAHAKSLIVASRFTPTEGKKEDEAHPAIFPTGIMPSGLTSEEQSLYDLIVRRFLGCFSEAAMVNRLRVVISFGDERYSATGAAIMKKGWLSIYPFVQVAEQQLPPLRAGERVRLEKAEIKKMQTMPPKRFTKAGLIAELERRDLGTKATRAAVIDTLIRRNYATGAPLSATSFGLSVFSALEENCSMIVDEATTRKLEEDMEGISRGKKTEGDVVSEGKEMLLEALKAFDSNKDRISEMMRVALSGASKLGTCPVDGGDLVIRRSRAGKMFAACANYPKCTNTYSVPQNAKIETTGRTCEYCKTPIIKVIRKGRRPFEMDLDPNCVTKKEWGSKTTGSSNPEGLAPAARALEQKPAATPAVLREEHPKKAEPKKRKHIKKGKEKGAQPKPKVRTKTKK